MNLLTFITIYLGPIYFKTVLQKIAFSPAFEPSPFEVRNVRQLITDLINQKRLTAHAWTKT